MGDMMLHGTGTRQNVSKGMQLLFTAASEGSDYACFSIGMDYATGENGLDQRSDLAVQWLQKSLSDNCEYQDMDKDEKAQAHEQLQLLMELTARKVQG